MQFFPDRALGLKGNVGVQQWGRVGFLDVTRALEQRRGDQEQGSGLIRQLPCEFYDPVAGAGSTLMDTCWVATAPLASVMATVKVKVPAVVGVPRMAEV